MLQTLSRFFGDPTLFYSAEAALLFVTFSCPLAYRATQATLGRATSMPTVDRAGRPTVFGILVHALLFALSVWAIMAMARATTAAGPITTRSPQTPS